MRFSLKKLLVDCRRNWSFGRWALLSQLTRAAGKRDPNEPCLNIKDRAWIAERIFICIGDKLKWHPGLAVVCTSSDNEINIPFQSATVTATLAYCQQGTKR